MTVSIVEMQAVNVASGSSSTALSTTLVSSDLVLIVMSKGSSGTNTVSMNSSAITAYNNWQNGIGSTRLYVYQKTGLTGSHSVSYSFGAAGRMTIYVIRGLSNSAITNSAISVWDGTVTSLNTDEGTSSLSVGLGQVAVAAGTATGGTITFPSNSTPSSGWAADRTDASGTGTASVISYVFSASGSAQVNIRTSTGAQIACALIIVGDVVSDPALVNTFVGWGNPIF